MIPLLYQYCLIHHLNSLQHTAGQKLNYHLHIHAIVTGGGLTPTGRFIKGPHKGFLIPLPVIAQVFRAKYPEGLKALRGKGNLSFPGKLSKLRNRYEWKEYIDSLFGKEWLPFLKGTFNGKGNAVEYLARYTFRTAISNSRIDSVDADGVTFHHKDYADEAAELCLSFFREINEINVTEYDYLDMVQDSGLTAPTDSPLPVIQLHQMVSRAEKFTPFWYAILEKEDVDNWHNLASAFYVPFITTLVNRLYPS